MKHYLVIGSIFFLIGTGFLYYGVNSFNENRKFSASAIEVEGLVTSYERIYRKKVVGYAPVFTYQYKGKSYQGQSKDYYMSSSDLLGKKLKLKIDPANPHIMKTSDISGWYETLLELVFGVLFSLFGFFTVRAGIIRIRTVNQLKMRGTRVSAKVVSIVPSGTVIMGVKYLNVVCKWIHPEIKVSWTFFSEDLHHKKLAHLNPNLCSCPCQTGPLSQLSFPL